MRHPVDVISTSYSKAMLSAEVVTRCGVTAESMLSYFWNDSPHAFLAIGLAREVLHLHADVIILLNKLNENTKRHKIIAPLLTDVFGLT